MPDKPRPEGPLEHHQFEGNPLRSSKVERLTGSVGWLEVGKFPPTVDGLSRAVRCYQRLRAQPDLMGVALWVGPALAACELSQSVRRFYKEGPPALIAPVLIVKGEPSPQAEESESMHDDSRDDNRDDDRDETE